MSVDWHGFDVVASYTFTSVWNATPPIHLFFVSFCYNLTLSAMHGALKIENLIQLRTFASPGGAAAGARAWI
eukprot:scaffold17327_cov34-Prasinocladus_malaysianus.AAC.1